ncbi:MAG: hypothetical protein ACFE9A_13695 [Candidatus Hodarchaeota archaeon]
MNEYKPGSELNRDYSNPHSSIKFPSPIKNIELSATEQRVYLQLSLEFQKILDDAPSFQMGAYQWNQILPIILQRYALSSETWERISEIGDQNKEIQAQLYDMIEEME